MIKREESCDSQKDLSSSGETENAPEASIQMEVEVSNMILKKINFQGMCTFSNVVQPFLLLKGWCSTRELIQERSMTNVQNVMKHSIKLVISNNT